jgi:hypothetical protein
VTSWSAAFVRRGSEGRTDGWWYELTQYSHRRGRRTPASGCPDGYASEPGERLLAERRAFAGFVEADLSFCVARSEEDGVRHVVILLDRSFLHLAESTALRESS